MSGLLKRAVIGLALFGAQGFGTWKLFASMPTGFIPQEDQGYFIVAGLLPQGAARWHTDALAKRVEEDLLRTPGVRQVITLGGQNTLAGGVAGTNAYAMFVTLEPWDERKVPEKRLGTLLMGFYQRRSAESEGLDLAFNAQQVPGLGTRVGFEYQLLQESGDDVRELAQVSAALVQNLRESGRVAGLSTKLDVSLPQVKIELDRARAQLMGVPISDVYMAMQTYLSALHVNDDFVLNGRVYRVNIQAAPEHRGAPEDLGRFHVRSPRNEMVPPASLVSVDYAAGPNMVSRFNGYPAVQIAGAPAAGLSTGDSIRLLRELSAELPAGYGFVWSGQT